MAKKHQKNAKKKWREKMWPLDKQGYEQAITIHLVKKAPFITLL